MTGAVEGEVILDISCSNVGTYKGPGDRQQKPRPHAVAEANSQVAHGCRREQVCSGPTVTAFAKEHLRLQQLLLVAAVSSVEITGPAQPAAIRELVHYKNDEEVQFCILYMPWVRVVVVSLPVYYCNGTCDMFGFES